ncbi:ATP-binding cassette domain-containing protein [Virgisporangium aurantiacum]|uniref:ABC transporter domain-containing protein n=1 Tax=Virgisporangium aurantiacum TaxID=175570 RepID=A0A8J4E6F3_9ACTN|nr:ATP-binding cassette domain-containing protein [Virgisporangium aurantiacum]GIJ63174.1 hypothetical protein Vau01_106900 [Virgisporangium aurantiacum]
MASPSRVSDASQPNTCTDTRYSNRTNTNRSSRTRTPTQPTHRATTFGTAQGLVLDHSVRDNLLLPLLGRIGRGPFLSDREGNSLARSLIQRFSIKVANPNRPVRLLSGGNQQKVVIAKWLGIEPDVLIMDEPTAGVDIGTKSEILDMIRSLADDGKGIIVISSELPELLAVCDRILVLRDGSVAQDLHRRDVRDEESLQLAVQGV